LVGLLKSIVRKIAWRVGVILVPDLYYVTKAKEYFEGTLKNTLLEEPVKLNPPYTITESKVGKYTYISQNASISYTEIGRFCSIGPNLVCGWGIHPINGISTSPMFYSTRKQNGHTLASKDKVEERRPIIVGNDVFIGMNVTILDGITVGDGAVIGAGTLVSKNVPPYAVVVGNPMKILRHRFTTETVEKFLTVKWWNFDETELKDVEKLLFDPKTFLLLREEK
jgi:virginiamycin A acetyltransferase